MLSKHVHVLLHKMTVNQHCLQIDRVCITETELWFPHSAVD